MKFNTFTVTVSFEVLVREDARPERLMEVVEEHTNAMAKDVGSSAYMAVSNPSMRIESNPQVKEA